MFSFYRQLLNLFSLVLASTFLGHVAFAQALPAPYGSPITFDQAKKVMAAAEAEAQKNKWQVVISVVDSGGHVVSLQRLDAQTGSVEVATGKAMTAAAYRRTSKSIEDALTAGGAGLRLLGARNATPLQGGVPIIHDGKIIGAIGVSGVLGSQDEQIAMTGAAALSMK